MLFPHLDGKHNKLNMTERNDIQEIWGKAATHLRNTLNADCYERWIANIVPVRLENKVFTLGVSNDIFCDWLKEHYKDLIENALQSSFGQRLKVVFEKGHEPVYEAEKSIEVPAIQDVTQKATLPVQTMEDQRFNERYTFDSFIVGSNNRFAHGASLAVAEAPGTAYNPLFIHSPTGLGKTHLLQAIAQDVLRRNPNSKIEYLTSEVFGNLYIDALTKRTLPAFRSHFRSVDILLVDDVQFFGSKETFQEEFFHTFNGLYDSHKQIVLASDRPPHEIGGLEKRLVSRFEMGLTADIQQPDLETRIAILHKKQEEHTVKFCENVLHYLAEHIKSNIRRLEGALLRLVSYASLTGKDIDIETAESRLSDIFDEESDSQVNVEQIQRVVADHYAIRFADMTSARRHANIVLPRQIAMYLARKLTNLSLPAIAEQFNRNHATVLHGINAVSAKEKESIDFSRELQKLERKLK